jgi:hypothetical protein
MKRISLGLVATASLLLLLSPPLARAQTITAVAGTGIAGSAGDGGLATNATLNLPTRVVVDATNNLLIVEQAGHRIRRVSAAMGVITTFANTTGTSGSSGDGGAATAAQLRVPVGLGLGRISVSCSTEGRTDELTERSGQKKDWQTAQHGRQVNEGRRIHSFGRAFVCPHSFANLMSPDMGSDPRFFLPPSFCPFPTPESLARQ